MPEYRRFWQPGGCYRERAIWQRRYWEHLIRHERDFRAHLDYQE